MMGFGFRNTCTKCNWICQESLYKWEYFVCVKNIANKLTHSLTKTKLSPKTLPIYFKIENFVLPGRKVEGVVGAEHDNPE